MRLSHAPPSGLDGAGSHSPGLDGAGSHFPWLNPCPPVELSHTPSPHGAGDIPSVPAMAPGWNWQAPFHV